MSADWGQLQPPRLPIYLLLDTSHSMAGGNIVAVNTGVSAIYQELASDPRSMNTVHISLITFADQAYQVPLVPIMRFVPPQLSATGRCALGGALHLLNESLDRDIIKNRPGRKGDYRPVVFLLTGGWTTDQWELEAGRLRGRSSNRPTNIIGLATGDDARLSVIQQVATVTINMRDVTPESLRQFFAWISASIKTTSQATPQTRRDIDFGK